MPQIRAAQMTIARRKLLQFMLESPLLAAGGGLAAWWPEPTWARPELAIPTSARQALDVFQMKAVARQTLDVADWHFVVNGADDGNTMAANRTAFDAWQIRARRLVDVSQIDMSVNVLGETLASPILLAPVGSQQRLHEAGELATVRAAARKHRMICSTMTSHSIAEIAAEAAEPLWFQLYISKNREFTKKLIDDAEQAGCRVLVLTIDGPTLGNRQGERWFRGASSRFEMRLGNFENYAGPAGIGDASMTWDIVRWLRSNTRMKIVLKGIVTREDAQLCLQYGVDGIVVSNHGGRQEESNRGTLESLPEVLDGADDRLPVLIDGGFRRGTDIFKALGLGAKAICIGRPYLWGLGAFGEEGVSRVLSLLRSELKRIMQFAGTTTLAAIGEEHLVRRP
ncbi:MAG: alpha-hydroxy-acid oxidizing protein [Gammaproteobacteria bacterium]|nr:alpha-hydroxy-acid oxidizing protein [Gammaproteobacteria bacterium]